MKKAGLLNYKDVILALIGSFFLIGSINIKAQTVADDPLSGLGTGAFFTNSKGDPDKLSESRVLATDIQMRVTGIVATVLVKQTFANQTDDWVEGIYAFPLPENAAVNRMTMTIGERVIEGQIRERHEAKKIYDAASKAGQQASLVSQQRPNLFTTKATNIPPRQEIQIRITYVQELSYHDGQFSLRFPMTLGHHYRPGAASGSQSVEGVATQSSQIAITASTASMQIELEPGFDLARLESRYHDIKISEEYRGEAPYFTINFNEDRVMMDRDFELVWEPTIKTAPQAIVLTERYQDDDYALVMLLPPRPTTPLMQPRELLLVIDTSGSMHGTSLNQAKQSLQMALGTLGPDDRFNVIEFNSQHRLLFESPQAATDDAILQADSFIQSLQADGGTNMLPALQAALDSPYESRAVRQVVFVTDGGISNETELFGLIEARLGNARLFTVGIGSAPNSYFMRKAAQFGRGSSVTIGDPTAVAEKMDHLLTRLEHPAITELRSSWVESTESYPMVLPDLYLSEPLIIASKLPDNAGELELSGFLGAAPWQDRLQLADQVAPGEGIATLWARRKVGDLMDELALGADREQIRGHVLETALRFALVTQFTSFVAVDTTPLRKASEELKQQNIQGPSPSAIALPQTATASLLHLIFGLLLITLAIAFNNRLRDDQ